MNIAQAKEQIERAMKAYFTKDEFGDYKIPVEKQRPVFLMGPPGIGKTAIMEQIASELGVGLVSYSMTHHTRQSALGLPYITEQEYDGIPYQLSQYTMSEIIGAIYQLMKETGIREGILFLDEINCVSETLAPCMLQFLQYKVFGQHRIPRGWIVVTAGNPPEYNKSVRDFDIVTWDRLKRIDVEADYETWKIYATQKRIHPAVLTYLAARKKDFYLVESTVDGRHFVTARGWEDLSEMMKLYEENGIPVDGLLIGQYIQHEKIAKDFSIYYDLFQKYRSDYQIDSILDGTSGKDILFRAKHAPMDERLSFLGLLFDAITSALKEVCQMEDVLDGRMAVLKEICQDLSGHPGVTELLYRKITEKMEELEIGRKASTLSRNKQTCLQGVITALQADKMQLMMERNPDAEAEFAMLKTAFERNVSELKEKAQRAGEKLTNAFSFCEAAFGQGDEILIFVTELTVNYDTARYIGHYGCDAYYVHNKKLQFAQRQMELEQKVKELDWTL